MRIWKTAVITGVVTDESGDPIVGAQLRALERSTVAGQSRFTAAGAPAFTDDRGMYRFATSRRANISSPRSRHGRR